MFKSSILECNLNKCTQIEILKGIRYLDHCVYNPFTYLRHARYYISVHNWSVGGI